MRPGPGVTRQNQKRDQVYLDLSVAAVHNLQAGQVSMRDRVTSGVKSTILKRETEKWSR